MVWDVGFQNLDFANRSGLLPRHLDHILEQMEPTKMMGKVTGWCPPIVSWCRKSLLTIAIFCYIPLFPRNPRYWTEKNQLSQLSKPYPVPWQLSLSKVVHIQMAIIWLEIAIKLQVFGLPYSQANPFHGTSIVGGNRGNLYGWPRAYRWPLLAMTWSWRIMEVPQARWMV